MIQTTISLDDDNYLSVNANSTEKLRELIIKLNKLFPPETQIERETLPTNQEVTAVKTSGEIKIGPVVFPDGTTGYFQISVGDDRVKLPWEAAKLYCANKGCFLPTKDELDLIIKHKDYIDKVDTSTHSKLYAIGDSYIWSSSEYVSNYAWIQRPSDGNQDDDVKSNDYWVVPFKRC